MSHRYTTGCGGSGHTCGTCVHSCVNPVESPCKACLEEGTDICNYEFDQEEVKTDE